MEDLRPLLPYHQQPANQMRASLRDTEDRNRSYALAEREADHLISDRMGVSHSDTESFHDPLSINRHRQQQRIQQQRSLFEEYSRGYYDNDHVIVSSSTTSNAAADSRTNTRAMSNLLNIVVANEDYGRIVKVLQQLYNENPQTMVVSAENALVLAARLYHPCFTELLFHCAFSKTCPPRLSSSSIVHDWSPNHRDIIVSDDQTSTHIAGVVQETAAAPQRSTEQTAEQQPQAPPQPPTQRVQLLAERERTIVNDLQTTTIENQNQNRVVMERMCDSVLLQSSLHSKYQIDKALFLNVEDYHSPYALFDSTVKCDESLSRMCKIAFRVAVECRNETVIQFYYDRNVIRLFSKSEIELMNHAAVQKSWEIAVRKAWLKKTWNAVFLLILVVVFVIIILSFVTS
jgi:hypothetical protein